MAAKLPKPKRVLLNMVGNWNNGDVGFVLDGKDGKLQFRMSRTEARHLLKGLTVSLPSAERARKRFLKRAAA